MSTAARDLPWLLLYHPAPRPSRGALRTISAGIFFSLVLLAGYLFFRQCSIGAIEGEMIAGITVSVFLWGSFSVWRHTVQPLLHGRGTLLRALTRLPFWFMAGGMGYTVAMLTAELAGMLPVRDRPAAALFLSGGEWFAGIQLVWEMVNYFVQRRRNI